MKTNLLQSVAFAMVMTTCLNCSLEPTDTSESLQLESQNFIDLEQAATITTCSGSNPKTRIANNGTFSSDYQIYDNTGVFIDGVYGVLPGTISNWITFPVGNIICNVTIDSVSDQKVTFNMATCTELNMEIDLNNQLTDAQPEASTN